MTDQDCHWWSWTPETGICEALHDCPRVDETKTGTVSGERGCSVFSCDVQGQCEGTLVDGFISPNKVEFACLIFHEFCSSSHLSITELLSEELPTRCSMSLVHILLRIITLLPPSGLYCPQ